jgi:hypothetical protein
VAGVRVILLSPGPSLEKWDGNATGDIVIAVNRAIVRHPSADFWSCGDLLTVQRHVRQLPAPPILWTHTDEARRLRREFPGMPHRTYLRDEAKPWTTFSATAALMLAGELGAERVDCFGCDMSGELNWDNSAEPTANRTESRWQRERVAWDALVGILAERGVSVTRAAK